MFRGKKRALAKEAAVAIESFHRARAGGQWPPEDEMWRIAAAVLVDTDSAGAAQFSRFAFIRIHEYMPLANHPLAVPTWLSMAITTAALDHAQAKRWGGGNEWSADLAEGLRKTAKDAATLQSGLAGEPAEMVAMRWSADLGKQPIGEQVAQAWCL